MLAIEGKSVVVERLQRSFETMSTNFVTLNRVWNRGLDRRAISKFTPAPKSPTSSIEQKTQPEMTLVSVPTHVPQSAASSIEQMIQPQMPP